MELPERRFARLVERLDALVDLTGKNEDRLGRIQEELDALVELSKNHEHWLTRVEDHLAVQGELLNRIDQKAERLAQMFVESAGERAEDRERLRIMQAAVTSLFERMDAFLRGLERHAGRERPGSE